MPVDGCAFVAWMMASISAVLCFAYLVEIRNPDLLLLAGLFAAVVVGLSVLVLAYKFS